MSNLSKSDSYAAAGVDVTAGYEAVNRIKPLVASTNIPGVLGGLGGFGGLFEPNVKDMKRPVLVSGTDGVGTKLKLAFLMDKHDTVGIDCVAMCVNDVICGGASPLFFLDYIACGKNDPARIEQIVTGITDGCKQAGCALVGGETAEMPGFYPEDEYDLAGFTVGMVDYDQIIDGKNLKAGDALIGLASSGVHSNGFSLVRKVFGINEETVKVYYDELGTTLGEALLTPTRIYVKAIQALLSGGIQVNAVSHITGGGFYENVPRMMTQGLCAQIKLDTFPRLPIFDLIQKAGNIPTRDMYNTFNMGIGMIAAVPAQEAQKAVELLTQAGEKAYVIGTVVPGDDGVEVID
jgi:phosphoribosylformylglycinamidine cyclo-ligase